MDKPDSTSTIRELQNQIESLKEKYAKENERKECIITRLHKEKKDLETTLTGCEETIERLEKDVKGLKDEKKLLERTKNKVVLKNNFLLEKCEESEKTIERVKTEVEVLLRENDRVKFVNKLMKWVAVVTEENAKHAAVVEVLKRENEWFEVECAQIKVAMRDLKKELYSVNTKQNTFEEKIDLLKQNLKNNVIEKQGLLKRSKQLETENNGLKKLVKDTETQKSKLQEKTKEKQETLELLLNEIEVLKDQLTKKTKKKWKLFCLKKK